MMSNRMQPFNLVWCLKWYICLVIIELYTRPYALADTYQMDTSNSTLHTLDSSLHTSPQLNYLQAIVLFIMAVCISMLFGQNQEVKPRGHCIQYLKTEARISPVLYYTLELDRIELLKKRKNISETAMYRLFTRNKNATQAEIDSRCREFADKIAKMNSNLLACTNFIAENPEIASTLKNTFECKITERSFKTMLINYQNCLQLEQTFNYIIQKKLRDEVIQPPYIYEIILLMYDLLKAVDHMHGMGVYHLDLQPDTVNFKSEYKWSPSFWRSTKNKELTVWLKYLEYATPSRSGKVPIKAVGMTEFYKPPECFSENEVDAGKVDSWGIGIIAFEAFTCGILDTNRSLDVPASSRSTTILERVRKRGYHDTAMEKYYCVTPLLTELKMTKREIEGFDMNANGFFTDCWAFVTGLLRSNPESRLSVQQALNTRLMRRVRVKERQVEDLYYIDYNF